ncbi:MAG TPA: hypothetical protein EYQ24_09590 [Bacteroidetes bacterium]|nr:hypothetical protein [Bacteroidota bacterium]
MSELQTSVLLPSTEYKATFCDGSVSILSVHPDESLKSALDEMLQAASGALGPPDADVEVQSVELIGMLSFDEAD